MRAGVVRQLVTIVVTSMGVLVILDIIFHFLCIKVSRLMLSVFIITYVTMFDDVYHNVILLHVQLHSVLYFTVQCCLEMQVLGGGGGVGGVFLFFFVVFWVFFSFFVL